MRRAIVVTILWWVSSVALGANGDLALTAGDREDLALTVYRDFAVIREVRRSVLPRGGNVIEFRQVANTVDPSSVTVETGDGDGLTVISQTYKYDLLNKQSLLEHFIGSKLKYSRIVLEGTRYEKVLREGILLSTDPEIVQFGDEIEIEPQGVISLPYLPKGLYTSPTLVWRIDNRARGPQSVKTSYVAERIGWRADYLLVLNESESAFDLSAWVNVDNRSGLDYPEAALELVAGQVNRVRTEPVTERDRTARFAMAAEPEPEQLSDYYVYDMPGRVNLANNQTTQLRLMDASSIPVTKSYVLQSAVPINQMRTSQADRFDIRLSFDNTLGPLPGGRVRTFKSDETGTARLLGEDTMPHTPSGETVEITIGKAFDLIAERTQTRFRRTGDRSSEIGYEIALRNRKDEKVTLVLHEKLFGDWVVIEQTEDGKRLDSTTQEYIVELDAGASRTFEYTVRVEY